MVAGFFVYFIYKKSRHLFPSDFFWRVTFFTGLSVIFGAKIFHYLENYLTYQVLSLPFFSPAGYSILGAISLGYLTLWFLSIIYKFNLNHLTDKLFLYLPVFQSLGRFGNILNNELLPYAYYEIALNFLNFTFLSFASGVKKKEGLVTALFFLNYGLIRIVIEILKGNFIGFLTVISYLFFAYGFLKTFKIIFKL